MHCVIWKEGGCGSGQDIVRKNVYRDVEKDTRRTGELAPKLAIRLIKFEYNKRSVWASIEWKRAREKYWITFLHICKCNFTLFEQISNMHVRSYKSGFCTRRVASIPSSLYKNRWRFANVNHYSAAFLQGVCFTCWGVYFNNRVVVVFVQIPTYKTSGTNARFTCVCVGFDLSGWFIVERHVYTHETHQKRKGPKGGRDKNMIKNGWLNIELARVLLNNSWRPNQTVTRYAYTKTMGNFR